MGSDNTSHHQPGLGPAHHHEAQGNTLGCADTADAGKAAATAAAAGSAVVATGAHVQAAGTPARAATAPQLDVAHTSSYESAGTGTGRGSHQLKSSSKQQHGQGFVPRKDANDNVPCFVQTSALFTNVSTSTCFQV